MLGLGAPFSHMCPVHSAGPGGGGHRDYWDGPGDPDDCVGVTLTNNWGYILSQKA